MAAYVKNLIPRSLDKIRAIAIHLPQYHTIPENDQWWGKGFTEWTNVKKAKPLFDGHIQPHVPLNNNYYDLNDNKALCDQAKMAKEYGIHGFCFYHYWFNGKKLLEKPLEQMLEQGTPDFPFMLCWANENWTRTWDGMDKHVLMKQDYGFEDDEAHFDYLLPFFKDDRYIKIDGKPVFLVYRTELFPDINKTAEIWRQKAKENGLPGIYLIRVEGWVQNVNPESIGFDAAMYFQPNAAKNFFNAKYKEPILEKIPRLVKKYILRRPNSENPYAYKIPNVLISYKKYVSNFKRIHTKVKYKQFPSVFPGWDNSPRRQKNAFIFKESSPDVYGDWLQHTLNKFMPYSDDENLVFINAWNEWGEGNHLEPCEKWGYSYLEETKKALKNDADN